MIALRNGEPFKAKSMKLSYARANNLADRKRATS